MKLSRTSRRREKTSAERIGEEACVPEGFGVDADEGGGAERERERGHEAEGGEDSEGGEGEAAEVEESGVHETRCRDQSPEDQGLGYGG